MFVGYFMMYKSIISTCSFPIMSVFSNVSSVAERFLEIVPVLGTSVISVSDLANFIIFMTDLDTSIISIPDLGTSVISMPDLGTSVISVSDLDTSVFSVPDFGNSVFSTAPPSRCFYPKIPQRLSGFIHTVPDVDC